MQKASDKSTMPPRRLYDELRHVEDVFCGDNSISQEIVLTGVKLFSVRTHFELRADDEQRRLLKCKGCFFERTATAGTDVVQSGCPIFDDFFQHLWPYIGNNTANVVFQMVKRLWLIRIDQ
ncbi:hypothetical protein TNCV_2101481 [Trichonephila clavipes]|nr:hypothetical protein TNCV_2101481 [Trichonephila clavipes]